MALIGFSVFLVPVVTQLLDLTTADPQSDIKTNFREIFKQCNETTPTEMRFLEQLNSQGKINEDGEDLRPPFCFLRCIYGNAGLMSEDGVFDAAKIKETYHALTTVNMPDMDQMIDSCIEQDTFVGNMCKRTYLFVSCLMTEELNRYGTTGISGGKKDDTRK